MSTARKCTHVRSCSSSIYTTTDKSESIPDSNEAVNRTWPLGNVTHPCVFGCVGLHDPRLKRYNCISRTDNAFGHRPLLEQDELKSATQHDVASWVQAQSPYWGTILGMRSQLPPLPSQGRPKGLYQRRLPSSQLKLGPYRPDPSSRLIRPRGPGSSLPFWLPFQPHDVAWL